MNRRTDDGTYPDVEEHHAWYAERIHPNNKRWEYHSFLTVGFTTKEEERALNALGESGWELVSALHFGGNQVGYYLKRQK